MAFSDTFVYTVVKPDIKVKAKFGLETASASESLARVYDALWRTALVFFPA